MPAAQASSLPHRLIRIGPCLGLLTSRSVWRSKSGRPVLVVPYAGRYPEIARHAVIAWKPTREAARAVFDALPLLKSAQSVQVIEVNQSRDEGTDLGITAALERHGIKAMRRSMVAPDTSVGDQILSRLADQGCRPARHGRLWTLAHAGAGLRRCHAPHRPAHDGSDALVTLSAYIGGVLKPVRRAHRREPRPGTRVPGCRPWQQRCRSVHAFPSPGGRVGMTRWPPG